MRLLRLFIAACVAATSLPALAATPSSSEWQYIEAIRAGDIQKARDLAKLGGINPDNIAGRPVAGWIVERADGGLFYVPDAAYGYLFRELKQDINTPSGTGPTMFALLCNTMSKGTTANDYAPFIQTLFRIRTALDNGATVKAAPDAPDHLRDDQPFPRCLQAYIRYRAVEPFATDMLKLLEDYLARGADPNAHFWINGGDRVTPLTLATRHYDRRLLALLLTQKARVDAVFPVTDPRFDTCKAPDLPNNTLISQLPDPKDQDVALARPFLEEVIKAGADIGAPQRRVFLSGQCQLETKTLKQRALDAGQVAYAQMAQDLERQASPATTGAVSTPPKVPFGTRRVVATANVRRQPSTTAELLGTLNPGSEITVDATSTDGAWSRVDAPAEIAGWVFNAVLLRTTQPVVEAAPADALAAMAFVLNGFEPGSPYVEEGDAKNAAGEPREAYRREYDFTLLDPCRLEASVKFHLSNLSALSNRWESREFTVRYQFDFTRMTGLRAELQPHPAEALYQLSIHNARYKPRNIILTYVVGNGAMCELKDDGSIASCSDGERQWAMIDNLAATPERLQAAFQNIRSRCIR